MNLLERLQQHIRADADIVCKPDLLAQFPVFLIGSQSLIEITQTKLMLNIQLLNGLAPGEKLAPALLSRIGEWLTEPDIATIMSRIRNGKLIVYFEQSDVMAAVDAVPKSLTRSIEGPIDECTVQGPGSAFNEDLGTNIGLLKKELDSPQLRIEQYQVGTSAKVELAVVYLNQTVNPKMLQQIKERIEEHLAVDVLHLQHLTRILGYPSWSAVSMYNKTELPRHAAYALTQGKVVLFLDRMQIALILPNLIGDLLTSVNDHVYPKLFMIALRVLRVIGLLSSLIMPGLYVALVSVNPEVLRIELALAVANSRTGVPYPALVETILFLLLLDMIMEASVRLPKTIGPTITMVGGIILGQAVVSAKLVSNLLIIILSATTIANSTINGFQNTFTIRILKLVLLVLSAFYGVLGLLTGMVLVCGYLASVTSFGIPFLQLSAKLKDDRYG